MGITQKHVQANQAMMRLRQLMEELKPDLHLIINYFTMTDELLKEYDPWYIERFRLLSGEEYVMIRKREDNEWPLLYVLNVSGTSVQYIAAEVMDLLAKKF